MAWLDTTPEGSKDSRRALYKGSALSDLQPETYYSWVIEMALECGLFVTTGFGAVAISWVEILAWQEATDNKGLWFAGTVHAISVAYTSELSKAKDKARPSPINYRVDEGDQRSAVTSQLKIFKGG